MRRLLLTVTTVLNLSTHPELNFLSAKQPSSFVSHLGLKERLQFSIQHQLPFCICVVFSQFDQTRRDKTKQKFRFTECWKSIMSTPIVQVDNKFHCITTGKLFSFFETSVFPFVHGGRATDRALRSPVNFAIAGFGV